MQEELSKVKIGLALVMLSLVFGIGHAQKGRRRENLAICPAGSLSCHRYFSLFTRADSPHHVFFTQHYHEKNLSAPDRSGRFLPTVLVYNVPPVPIDRQKWSTCAYRNGDIYICWCRGAASRNCVVVRKSFSKFASGEMNP